MRRNKVECEVKVCPFPLGCVIIAEPIISTYQISAGMLPFRLLILEWNTNIIKIMFTTFVELICIYKVEQLTHFVRTVFLGDFRDILKTIGLCDDSTQS